MLYAWFFLQKSNFKTKKAFEKVTANKLPAHNERFGASGGICSYENFY